MSDPLREISPGVWEWQGDLAPWGVIRFLRHEGHPCYRVTKWKPDGDGALIGYYGTIHLARSALGDAIQAHARQFHEKDAPNDAWARSIAPPKPW